MSILNELDTYIIEDSSESVKIIYEDLSDDGRKKILEALNTANPLLNIFKDDQSRQEIELKLFGSEGKEPVTLFTLDVDYLKNQLDQ